MSDNIDAVRWWATLIGSRYVGSRRAEEYGQRNGVAGELLVSVTPANITAVRDIAD